MQKGLFNIIYQWLLILTFIVFLCTPPIKMFLTQKSYFSFTEKRALAHFPHSPQSPEQIRPFFKGVDTYFDDHFGFRGFFIYRYQREVRKRFGITGSQTLVHQGINGWLYLGQTDSLLDYAGKNLLSQDELKNWVEHYQKKRTWLAEKGIQYLLIAAPDKQRIYPEHLMENWQELYAPGRLQQLIEARPEIAQRELITLAGPLKKAKSTKKQVYLKSDTHWTRYGAYLAYLQIIKKLSEYFPGESFRTNFAFSGPKPVMCSPKQQKHCGDLAKMLLDFEPIEDQVKFLFPYRSCAKPVSFTATLSNLPAAEDKPTLVKKCQGKKLKAVIFRDSFFVALEPYVSENFGEVIYLWKSYDQQNIEEILPFFKPDIVIEERVERKLFLNEFMYQETS
ncbi:MAG: hypothetical protein CR981_04960 [Proteobacteria bacterium]|nr:MAG: hypothetical protein CR981_04960 [Pseudomonadota bacterium]